MNATHICVWLSAVTAALLLNLTLPLPTKPASATRTDQWAPGTIFRDCPACPVMVVIPAGLFDMGSPSKEEGRGRREGPQHRVVIERAFAVGKFEVTRGEFARFAQDTSHSASGCYIFTGSEWWKHALRDWQNPGFPQSDGHPVTCISWYDAIAYVKWLTGKTGRHYRLLTEAEWEYAARGGTTTVRYWGDGADLSCRYANVADQTAKLTFTRWPASNCSDGHAYTAPVGSFRENAFGLHDMLGNVAEWTEDCWKAHYFGFPSDGSPNVTGDCSLRSMRGGSFSGGPFGIRSAARSGSVASARWFYWGFRIARTQ